MRRFYVLLLLLVGAGSWATLRSYRQQTRLHQQLEELTQVLTTENDLASRNAQHTVKGIEAAVAKNRNQPTDRALLRHAKAIQTCAEQLVETLRTYGDQLRRATSNKEAVPLQHPNAAIGSESAKKQRQALAKQLAAYNDTLRQSGAAEATAAPLLAPTFEATTPVADALADLSRLEGEVLARQTPALKHISERVGARQWPMHPVATATAESNVVAPCGTYRAQLGVVSYFSANELRMTITCNGQPISVDHNGIGLVRFRAPSRPGPATWTGTIRLNSNGRDTTFKVKVPYRVARR